MFSSRCATELVPGMSSTRSSCASSHASATWLAVTPCLRGDGRDVLVGGEGLRAAGERRAEREVRHVGDPALPAQLEHVLVAPVEDAERVLHLAEPDQLVCASYGLRGDARDADQVDLALVAQLGERAELVLERGLVTVGVVALEAAQVDQVHALDPERAEVLLDLVA